MNAAIVALIFALFLQNAQAQEPSSEPNAGTSAAAQTEPASDSPTASAVGDSDQSNATTMAEEVDMGRGFAIAITGMSIVAVALVLILGFISALPRVLEALDPYLPEPSHHHGAAPKSHPESQVAEDEAVLAAIGYVLHTRMQQNS